MRRRSAKIGDSSAHTIAPVILHMRQAERSIHMLFNDEINKIHIYKRKYS